MGHGSNGVAAYCACGAKFTIEQWSQLEFVGVQDDGIDTLIELRNCPCGSTRARRCDTENALRLLNETAKRLRRALGRLRDIERATVGISAEIVDIDRGAVRVDDAHPERARALRIIRETLASVTFAGEPKTWVKTLSEILEARIAG